MGKSKEMERARAREKLLIDYGRALQETGRTNSMKGESFFGV